MLIGSGNFIFNRGRPSPERSMEVQIDGKDEDENSERHADKVAVLGSAECELAPDRGPVVPVVLSNELVGLFQVKRNRIHADM